jgi:hypothetical protein
MQGSARQHVPWPAGPDRAPPPFQSAAATWAPQHVPWNRRGRPVGQPSGPRRLCCKPSVRQRMGRSLDKWNHARRGLKVKPRCTSGVYPIILHVRVQASKYIGSGDLLAHVGTRAILLQAFCYPKTGKKFEDPTLRFTMHILRPCKILAGFLYFTEERHLVAVYWSEACVSESGTRVRSDVVWPQCNWKPCPPEHDIGEFLPI